MLIQNKNIIVVFKLMRPLLLPFVPLYLLVFNILKRTGQRYRSKFPVLCVGNLTTGGAGKTPAVIFTAALLREEGYSPAVVSRGYGGTKSKEGAVVSVGEGLLLSPQEAGDEPFLIASSLPGVPVAIGSSRVDSIRRLENNSGSDVIVMDDGLQNFTVHKDISIIIVDATMPFGNGLLIPAGDLREPSSSLGKGDIILINKSDVAHPAALENLEKKVIRLAPEAVIFRAYYYADSLRKIEDDDAVLEISALKGMKVLLVCAIGNPGAFYKTVERFDPSVLRMRVFPDHYNFLQKDINKISDNADDYDFIVVTEKDSAKMKNYITGDKFYYLKISMHIEDRDKFRDCLVDLLRGNKR